ncbi:MAG: hypothetical protein WCO00_04195 [Rhodospirillaceae bacterium]
MSADPPEARRLALQTVLDAARPAPERNRLGQFATPPALARELVGAALAWLAPGQPLHFLDPAFGTGSFLSALLGLVPAARLAGLAAFEIDRHYGDPAAALWRPCGLDLTLGDFTRAAAPCPGPATLIVCNPPYVRHHHLEPAEKRRLQAMGERATGIRLSGLAGLYAHFMLLADSWAAGDALAAWLVPAEFMDVNYGAGLRRYLSERVTLLRLHRFDPGEVQFGDALVTSAVLWWRHRPPPPGHGALFSYGGSIAAPRRLETVPVARLRAAPKWTAFPLAAETVPGDGGILGDLLTIKRGVATGDNRFFILGAAEIARRGLPPECFRPILPGPRGLGAGVTVIDADAEGRPLLANPRYLLDCRLPEAELAERHPALWRYLESGVPAVSGRYLCRHRTPWYAQDLRPPPPLLCTYMGRGAAPFRFLLNRSRATAPNVYLLLYPKPGAQPGLIERLWRGLNGIGAAGLIAAGRVYGGGLHKLEPGELARLPLAEVLAAADSAVKSA